MLSLKRLFSGDENAKTLKKVDPIVTEINALEESISALSDEELRGKTAHFRELLEDGKTLDDILPEAYAIVREASKRSSGERHYDVQLAGGIIMHQGAIAEMRTGEGKTLVATLPVYLHALTGKGVHVITVNDYLSRRDAVWMGQIYALLGLSIGVINSQSSYLYDPGHQEVDKDRDEKGGFEIQDEFLVQSTRPEAYAADITYGTNNEFGFDYLRDNIEYDKKNLRQRGHIFAVVDEIDSILIDEARTPLIISAPGAESENLYKVFSSMVSGFVLDTDYTLEEKHKSIAVTDAGIEKAEKMLGIDNIYTDKGIKYVHHLETAVRAKALFNNDKEYVVRDGEVIIVDEFTGRMQPGRRWSEGLHQAVEAKEGVTVKQESRTFASVTYQNYFRMYKQLTGMTGTAMTSQEEFQKVYGLDVVSVPTHRPIKRDDINDYIFQSEQGKFKAIAKQVKKYSDIGQPVLIGTASIEKNELLSSYLNQEGVKHEVLNAKNHENEGEIIAQAGRKGSVTIATNMAGRGVDIKLGGNPAPEEDYEYVKSLGGLVVLGTERHEARRIDNQLRGRSGRQGDPGITQFFVSLEDSLMRVFASDTIKTLMGRFGIPEDQPIENRMITKSLETAQTKIEGIHFDQRKHVLQYDDVMNHQRKSIYTKRQAVLLGEPSDIDSVMSEIDEGLTAIAVEKKEKFGDDAFYAGFRKMYLQIIDMLWMEHLEVMDYTRSSVNLRAYGQRDPLVEYKKEGLRMFKDLEMSLSDHVIRLLPTMGAQVPMEEQKQMDSVSKTAEKISSETNSQGTKGNKIGRNDPCHCGSGKKYKRCHGRNDSM
ncbi:preprotein translocase subunit SecA [Candidatus Wolfebacteria bacterium]|nr:MAG: preprotein translocase subunit SecA [Candidatus Wolfebacteria bacterium]